MELGRLRLWNFIRFVLTLDDGISITDFKKNCDITYCFARDVIKEFVKNEIVTMQVNPKCRREKLIFLTEKGHILKKLCKRLSRYV